MSNGKIPLDAVTGAGGFTGRAIAQRLVAAGRGVVNLTNNAAAAASAKSPVRAAPLRFDDEVTLAASLAGVDTLYNTYWIRFSHRAMTFDLAMRNTRTLLAAARRAGVRRVVHVSITNPSDDAPYPYFRGKATLEKDVRASGLSWAIIRPAVIFGPGDILINNLAWFLRRFGVFIVPGDGRYRIRPIFVDDLAALATTLGAGEDAVTVDAVGPRSYTFTALIKLVADAVGKRPRLVYWIPSRVLTALALFNVLTGDVVLTADELGAMADNLLDSEAPATGATELAAWLRDYGGAVGKSYASELKRHYRRIK